MRSAPELDPAGGLNIPWGMDGAHPGGFSAPGQSGDRAKKEGIVSEHQGRDRKMIRGNRHARPPKLGQQDERQHDAPGRSYDIDGLSNALAEVDAPVLVDRET
jgi:hypothetical protein